MDFKNSSILYYLLLLAIPIIIHLFNFRRHKKIYFSTIFFLKKIEKENKAKYQIRRWIILLNRILAITLIILAFGLPYIKKSNSSNTSNKTGFYIDNSFSMDRSDNKKIQLLEYAKNNAKKIINELNDDHKVLIMTNDFQKYHQKWCSAEKAIELINEITISKNPDKLETVIHRYNNIIDTLNINTLYLFSDFQSKSNRNKIIHNKYSNLKIGLLNVEDNNNVSIDSCYFTTPIRKKNEMENLSVIISNHGMKNRIVKAKLSINNQQKSAYNIEIPSNSSVVKEFHYVNPVNIDTIKGIIQLEDNNIEFDNKLYFSYATNQKVKVSVIHDETLNPSLSHVFSDSLFDFYHYNTNQIDYEKLHNFQLIIIDQVSTISNSLLKRLKDYLNHGGNIFIFLNETININSYNTFLQEINIDRIGKWKTGKYPVEYINYQNKIFENVFNKEHANINLPSANGYFSMKKNNKAQMRKILNFLNTDSFLSEYIYKKGRVFICSSDLSIDNNNFANHALFIPCIYNSALMNLQNEKLYHTIQNETIIEVLNIKKSDIINLQKEGKFDMTPKIMNLNQKVLINFQNKIPYAGNYNLITNQSIKSPISFNYNRSESSLIFSDRKDIMNMFYNQDIQFLKSENNTISKNSKKNKNQLEYFFITSAIILLIIELILLRIWKL